LIDEGSRLLEEASVGNIVSEFHLEAMIAFHHAQAPCCEETDWGSIVGLYDLLLKMRTSPVIALNRAIAIGQLEGPDCGLEALLSLPDRERLETYPFYPAAIADLYLKSGNSVLAKSYFAYAASLARNPAEKQFLLGRLGAC
jgi:RNA polymerase sigma-70 factor (ECF subfamily)